MRNRRRDNPIARSGRALMVRLADYVWTNGAVGNSDWGDDENWTGAAGFPSSSSDKATFPDNSETDWTVVHAAHTIGEMVCEEGVVFSGTSVTLTANKLVIDATGRTSALDVTISGSNGVIIANPP